MADKPTLYAHRGTNPYTDNQYDAYKWAFKYGADYVETDFRLTKDGALVSYHDDLPGGIANMTLAQVRAAVPGIVTLEELIVLTKQMEVETGRKLGILIETKSSGYATYDALLSKLVANDFADAEHIVFQTFASDHKVLRDLMDNTYHVDFPLVWLGDLTPATIANATNANGSMGLLDGIAPTMASLTPELVAAAHAAGLEVNGWTVAGTEADVRNALNLGVDGIINDNTQLARPALEKLLNNATVAYGTDQGSEINGSAGKDVVYAMSGDDIVRGSAGDDVLYGDAGNDLLFGGAGTDQLVGGSGTDFLAGGAGSDVLEGGSGNDVVVATGDEVVFRAGNGIDLISLDAASTIRFDGLLPTDVTVTRDGNNLIIRSGSDALVLLDGVDPAHQPASIVADGFTLTGAQLAALAVEGTDAEVAALLPELQAVLASAPGLAIPSTIAIGADLVAEGGFDDDVQFYQLEGVETGAVYRLSFSLADLPSGDNGVRVLWGGQVVYEGVPSAAGDKLHVMVAGGDGDGSNQLVFEGAGESFGAELDDVRLVKVANPVVPTPGNVAPVAPQADHLVSLDIPFSGRVAATDADGDALSYLLGDGPAHGTLVFNADGSYKYTAAAGFLGEDGFSYLVNDGHGGIVEATVKLTVVSGVPVGTDLIVNGSFEDLSESSGYNGGSDWGYRNQDGQIVGWTNVNNARIEQHFDNYGGVHAKDGQIWIDMDHSQTGSTVDRIGQSIAGVEAGATYRVSFSLSDSDTARSDDGVIVLWNGEVIFDGLAPQNTTGTNPAWQTFSFDVVGGSGNGANRLEFIDKGATDSWGAGAALDDVHFVKVADVPAGNAAPVAVDDTGFDTEYGTPLVIDPAALLGNDTDADHDTLVISSVAAGTGGTVALDGNGHVVFTPAPGFSGAASFTYTVFDGRGGTDTASAAITVGANPNVVAIGTDLIVNGSFEDVSESSFDGNSSWGYRNLDGQIVGWTNVNNNRIEQHYDNYGGVHAKDGQIWLDMDHSQTGTTVDRIGQSIADVETGATYRVSFSLSDSDTAHSDDGVIVLWNGEVIFDGLAPQNTTGTNPAWQTFSFDVVGGSGNGANRLEFIDKGATDSWGAGAALDDVHFVKVAHASAVAIGTDLIVNGSFEDLSESANYNGGSDWGYRNNDKQIVGWTNVNRIEQHLDNYGGVHAKDGTFWIDLDSSNLAQRNKLGQDIADVETGATYRVSFSLSDSDTARFDDGVTVLWNGEIIFSGLPPQTGTGWTTLSFDVVGGSGDGSNRLEFADTGAPDSWGAGVALDDVHFVKIADAGDTLPENHAPETADSHAEGLVNTLVTGQVTATDPDADASLNVSLKQGPAHGTVFVYTDGTYRYTPATGFIGEDSFTVLVNDGHGGNTEATVSLTISPPNTAPAAGDDAGVDTAYGTAVTIAAADLLANDSDADGHALAIQSVTAGTGGTVALDDDGNVVFTPEDGFSGEASFSYTVSDGHGGTASATVTVSVAPQPAAPGTAGDDVLVGTAGDDVIMALAGDDEVSGLAGNDLLDGASGDDLLDGGAGDDWLLGGLGDDALVGGSGEDLLSGGEGDDALDGGEGVDTADYSADTAGVTVDLAAGAAFGDAAGADELAGIENVAGGAGHDTLTGDDGANALDGGMGDDVLDGGAGDDTIAGGEGVDTLVLAAATGAIVLDLAAGTASAEGLGTDGFTAIEAFRLGAGDNVLRLVAGAAAVGAIDGGAGHDTLVLTGTGTLGELTGVEAVTLEGSWTLTDEGYDVAFGAGAQTLTLTAELLADGGFAGTLAGFGEEDRIELAGLAGTQATLGDGNVLTISGGAGGPVTLQLDPAQDFAGMAFTLASNGSGGVYLSVGPANAGDDVYGGGNGDDVYDGGAGNDAITGGAGDDALVGNVGDDTVDGGSGDDAVAGGAGDDLLKGGSGDDVIDGGAGNDQIDAGSGDDVVAGGAGDDALKGGSGDDILEGGAGNDMLAGGSGHDVFVFAAGFGHDVISDFAAAGASADVIEIAADLFAGFEAILAAAEQVGRDVVVTLDDDSSLTLANLALASLTADDFRFV